MNIVVSDEIRNACPNFIGACIEATIVNTPYSEELWEEIADVCEHCRANMTTESLKQISSIAATRSAYKACGKDPSRYRPSAEALLRRILQGKGLYRINTAADLINLASMAKGYSIGAFDASKFAGDTLTLGIGREGEPYEGIGRGVLNIAGLPVYRDAIGGVGTPTSDNCRTKIELTTTSLLVLVNGYDGDEQGVGSTAELIMRLLRDYCSSSASRCFIYK